MEPKLMDFLVGASARVGQIASFMYSSTFRAAEAFENSSWS